MRKILASFCLLFSAAVIAFSQESSRTALFFERFFGPSEAAVARRAVLKEAFVPEIADTSAAARNSYTKAVREPFARIPGYALPASSKNQMELDVCFLSDAECAGRATGTPGLAAAAMYVYKRFSDLGLRTYERSFKADGVVGHNVLAEKQRPFADKWIVVMARMDGVGDHDGKRFPGADANASGVAALLSLAGSSSSLAPGYNLLFAAIDGHHHSMTGADDLYKLLEARGIGRRNVKMVVNIEEIGSDLSPVIKGWKSYVLILGGERYEEMLWRSNAGISLHLNYDYYGSRSFTDLFYRKASDQKVFLDHGYPCVMFTSGITMNTNRPDDTPSTLNYDILGRRVELIRRWVGML